MSIFIHDCIECQQIKHINQKIQTASIQTFSENASYFNYRISMDTKGPINPPSNQNSYIHVIVDAFSHFVVTVPLKQNNAQKRKINSYAYFNKTYHNPRPLDIGTFVLKRNFLHLPFSDKLKPLRIGPFKIINKISDITYEIVNQDGYTSHIHRNHLIPYYPKEPIIFPFLQQYNPHLFSDCHSNINDQIINSDENQFSDEEQFPSTTFNKETDIPSTIDLQPESFSQYSYFRINKRNKFLKKPT